jgi:hypothetical protein
VFDVVGCYSYSGAGLLNVRGPGCHGLGRGLG